MGEIIVKAENITKRFGAKNMTLAVVSSAAAIALLFAASYIGFRKTELK